MVKNIKFQIISHASILISYGDVRLHTDPSFGFPIHFDTFHMAPPFSAEITTLTEKVNATDISHVLNWKQLIRLYLFLVEVLNEDRDEVNVFNWKLD